MPKCEYVLFPVFGGTVKIRGNNLHLQNALGTVDAKIRITELLENLSPEETNRERKEAAQAAEAAPRYAEEFELVSDFTPKPFLFPNLLLPKAICISLSRAIRSRS